MENLTLLSAMQQMLLATLFTVCLLTVPVLIVGVLISIVQAATQINEILVDEGSRYIQLVSGEGQLLHSFYLSNKNKRRFHHSVKHLYRKQYN